MLVSKIEYSVVLADGTAKKVIAGSIPEVCDAMKGGEEIVVITKDHVVDQYEVPDHFTVATDIMDTVAAECGCRVYPEKSVMLADGETLVLSAYEADGWDFVGWYNGEELVSQDRQALVTVLRPEEPTSMIIYEAKFKPLFSDEE